MNVSCLAIIFRKKGTRIISAIWVYCIWYPTWVIQWTQMVSVIVFSIRRTKRNEACIFGEMVRIPVNQLSWKAPQQEYFRNLPFRNLSGVATLWSCFVHLYLVYIGYQVPVSISDYTIYWRWFSYCLLSLYMAHLRFYSITSLIHDRIFMKYSSF